MNWGDILQTGIAVAVALGAKREMAAFRHMFAANLQSLTNMVGAHEGRISRVESAVFDEAAPGIGFAVASTLDNDE